MSISYYFKAQDAFLSCSYKNTTSTKLFYLTGISLQQHVNCGIRSLHMYLSSKAVVCLYCIVTQVLVLGAEICRQVILTIGDYGVGLYLYNRIES